MFAEGQAIQVCDRECLPERYAGKRVLAVIPDHTRSCPLDLMFKLVCTRLAGLATQLDFLVALGTHPPMTEDAIYNRVGLTKERHKAEYPEVRFFNHAWDDPDQLTRIGNLAAREISELTDGLFEMEVDVTVNRMIHDYDILLIIGPVFPHEVVGFSGGNKYIFPGIGGPELLNFFHWLGAVITSPEIIGSGPTPVRKVVDRAASMVPIERRALCMVVEKGELAGLYNGTPEEAWREAIQLSEKLHIEYCDHSYETVLSCAPEMYDELWVGAKCMYKLEPVVADGGELIIYAPHISEIAEAHGEILKEIGYHTRDYFLKQWERFKDYPWGVLAHSTHVKGIGTYKDGVEKPRIRVTLATGIPEAVCREINLGYRDPASINVNDYKNREENGVLCIPKAGEILYRLKEQNHE